MNHAQVLFQIHPVNIDLVIMINLIQKNCKTSSVIFLIIIFTLPHIVLINLNFIINYLLIINFFHYFVIHFNNHLS